MRDRAGRIFRKLRRGYHRGFGFRESGNYHVQLYRGYRSSTTLFVQGRVLEDKRIEVGEADRTWRNFINAIRRFNSNEVAGAVVELRYLGERYEVMADREGYIELEVAVSAPNTDDAWERITARIIELPDTASPHPAHDPTHVFHGEIADLDTQAEYAVVTDIDDTILKTDVTSLFKLKALWYTLADNAHTRLAFPGAPQLFQQLREGTSTEDKNNSVFYLSRSPWNLYDMLEQFLDAKGFPRGPIFLRDVGLLGEVKGSHGHKEATLLRLIEHFPTLKFVLVGDSGEKDADIYHAVAQKHPERIAAVVIRNVKNNANAHRIERMFARRPADEHYFLVKDSAEAALRLSELGLLNSSQVRAVQQAQ